MSHKVIIAGGGAAGMTLACELGLAGVPTVVLERQSEPPSRSAGMLLHARAFDTLRRRGLGDRFRNADTPTWPRTHFALLWLDLSTLGETDYDLLIPQWRTVQLLEERAQELHVDIRRGQQVTGVEQDHSGVTVLVRSDAGEQRLRGDYLVGCDGEESTVAGQAGFEFDMLASPYYGVIADVPVPVENRDHFQAGVFSRGQFGVLPVNPSDPGEVRLMTVEFFQEPHRSDTPVTVAELRASIERVTGTLPDFGEPRWLTRYGAPTRLAKNYRNGRILLVGDAAHSHPPSSGNGLNTAMHDAFNLGWKLAATVVGWAPPNLLDTYHDERHPVGHRACMRALAQVSLQHPTDQVGPLRELFAELIKFEDVNRYLVQLVTKVRYPISYPGDGQSHPLLGAPLPAALDAPGLLAAGRGVLLDLAQDTKLPDVREWADRVDVVRSEPESEIDARVLLVRPDGHIAFVDQTGKDQEQLVLALRTWFG